MELKLKIDLEDLLQLIQQLPGDQLALLKEKLINLDSSPAKLNSKRALKELISQAPTMSDEQYLQFIKAREKWNNWREE